MYLFLLIYVQAYSHKIKNKAAYISNFKNIQKNS